MASSGCTFIQSLDDQQLRRCFLNKENGETLFNHVRTCVSDSCRTAFAKFEKIIMATNILDERHLPAYALQAKALIVEQMKQEANVFASPSYDI